jgi:hypothetical protein
MPVILATQDTEVRRIGGSKPDRGNSSGDSIPKTPITKRAGRLAPGVGPKVRDQYHKKNFFKVTVKIKRGRNKKYFIDQRTKKCARKQIYR